MEGLGGLSKLPVSASISPMLLPMYTSPVRKPIASFTKGCCRARPSRKTVCRDHGSLDIINKLLVLRRKTGR